MPISVVIGLCSAILTAIVTELYAHRCLAHHAFRPRPALATALDTYFRVIVWTDPEVWAAVHRVHHRYADMPADPHSPRQRQPLAVLLGSPYLFAVARREVPAGRKAGKLVVVLRAVVPGFFFVAFGLVAGLIMVVVHLVCYLGIMGMVNTVGHLYGRKPHPDVQGYDSAWLAIPLLGHGYHNSHHAHPAAARMGRLDPMWPVVRVLSGLGLIRLEGQRASTQPRTCCTASGSIAPNLAAISSRLPSRLTSRDRHLTR